MLNILEIECSKHNLLKIAFTHPSFTQEHGLSHSDSYERLEFLGDSVLKLLTSKLLYEKYPNFEEGELSKIRSILVSDATLSQIAADIGIPEKIRLGYSEETTGGRTRQSNIACVFEAILGAYYLDGKIDYIEEFINDTLLPLSDDIETHFVNYNAKAVLQEYTQKMDNTLPIYKTEGVTGPQHKPVFEVSVTYQEKELARATGKSKKEAQQNCAYNACVKLGLAEGK